MISFSGLTSTQRALVAAGGLLLVFLLGALVAASDLDLVPFRTVKTVALTGGGSVLQTTYNPFGMLGLSVIGAAVVGGFVALFAWLAPLIMRIGRAGGASGVSAEAVDTAGKRLQQQLSQVLTLIRGHISINESYGKSLAAAQQRLGVLPEAEQVRVIVSLLVAENERMRRDSNELKGKLEDAHRQIDSLRASLSEAEEAGQQDALTGVGNRRRFDVTLEKAIAETRQKGVPLSLIMCDIDHFKRVNDAFGHQVGDEIIKMFSRVIQSLVRDEDTVIRYGGEEFAIILPKATLEEARSIAERVRVQFEAKKLTLRETNQKIGQMTASFGVAELRPGEAMELLVQRADSKLYDAKSAGRNRVAVFGSAG
jgi:diguanylate cyclase